MQIPVFVELGLGCIFLAFYHIISPSAGQDLTYSAHFYRCVWKTTPPISITVQEAKH